MSCPRTALKTAALVGFPALLMDSGHKDSAKAHHINLLDSPAKHEKQPTLMSFLVISQLNQCRLKVLLSDIELNE